MALVYGSKDCALDARDVREVVAGIVHEIAEMLSLES
jgi:hypothetical protein